MKEVKLSEDEKYLIDSDGIRFKRLKPLSTIEVKVSTANSQPGISSKVDFVRAIKNLPQANAYLNLGIIPEKSKVERITFSDKSESTAHWVFYQVELYHLGE